MMRAPKDYPDSDFVNVDLGRDPRVGAWTGRFPWVALEDVLNYRCTGKGEHESERLAAQIKRLESRILCRQVLLEEVIRRTNNTLQRTIGAVDAHIAAANDAWKAHDLRALRAQLRKLRSAHHQLYGPGDCVGSSLEARLFEICSSIFEALGRRSALVTLSLKAADVELPQHQEVCVCLMMQELVTNALKHGFPRDRSGTVSVELHLDPSSVCHLVVTDDGDLERTSCRAARLATVRGFASLLEGQLDFDLNQETTVRVSFPVD